MATHSSILAWGIPRTEEPRGLQSGESESNMTEQLTHTVDKETQNQRKNSPIPTPILMINFLITLKVQVLSLPIQLLKLYNKTV